MASDNVLETCTVSIMNDGLDGKVPWECQSQLISIDHSEVFPSRPRLPRINRPNFRATCILVHLYSEDKLYGTWPGWIHHIMLLQTTTRSGDEKLNQANCPSPINLIYDPAILHKPALPVCFGDFHNNSFHQFISRECFVDGKRDESGPLRVITYGWQP